MFTNKERVTFNYIMTDIRNGERVKMQRSHFRPEDDSTLFVFFMSDAEGFKAKGYKNISYEGSESNYGKTTIKGIKK